MRAHWSVALVTSLVMVLGGAAGAALATDPVSLSDSRVLDESGVLSTAEEQTVNSRLEALSSKGADVWVVYVDDFTDPSERYEWADEVATRNGLGTNQYLLAVATEGRQYAISGAAEGPVTWEQLDAIEQQRVQPQLAAGNWSGAAIAAAEAFEAALGGGSGGTDTGGGSFAPFLVLLVVIALAALLIWLVVRARKKTTSPAGGAVAPSGDALAQLSTAELGKRAASALVQTDDAIKTSEQELGFAQAQYGDATAAQFQHALTDAKDKLDQAFSLKQKLDDSVPDTEADVRQWNAQIIQLCADANSELDEKAAAFDELRKLEQNAPEALERVQGQYATVSGQQDAAAAALTALSQSYAPEALSTVTGNPAQAAQLLGFAAEHLTAAQTAVGAGQGSQAAVEIRAAEDAVAQAQLLQEAITKTRDDLAAAEQNAAQLVAELQTDIATASAMPDSDGRLAAVIAGTGQQVQAAQALLTGAGKRPVAAVDALTAANTQIDAVLAGVRDSQQQAQRAGQQLGILLTQAQGQISAAEDFITSRRGAVGAQARTRLAEAGASLVQARQLQATDPAQALSYAQRANDLASQAIQYAQNDVGAFSGGGLLGGSGSSGGGNMMGAVLGGIVINSLLGGGNRGGSRGGGSGGVFGGGSRPSAGGSRPSGGFGGGGRSPGSFGGGGTRGRRGGGRF